MKGKNLLPLGSNSLVRVYILKFNISPMRSYSDGLKSLIRKTRAVGKRDGAGLREGGEVVYIAIPGGRRFISQSLDW